MNTIQQKIKKNLKKAIEKTLADFRTSDVRKLIEDIHLEQPENPEYGDYSSNFAMAKFEKTNNKQQTTNNLVEFAQKIVENFPKTKYLEKIEAVKPGFINFYLKDEVFQNQLKEILIKKEKYGSSDIGKKTKVIVEFGQPNTHKLPHIGHFRSYALGEAIARLLEFSGFNVFRANYQGDVGLHAAKCLWAYLKKIKNQKSLIAKQLQGAKATDSKIKNLEEKIRILQECYVIGNRAYEENPETKKEIDELNTKIYIQDKSIINLWKKTRKWSLDYYELMNKRLNTFYHRAYFESEAAKKGKEIVLKHSPKIFKKSKGAIIFEGSKYGLHDRVFISSNGNSTYEAKDLALMFLKKKDFDYDLSLVSTASEQKEYFKVVYKAAGMFAPDLAKKFVHIPFGLVSLSGAKLSSRKGTIVSIDELLEKNQESLVCLMKEKNYTQKQINEIVDSLTIGASKYSILKHTPIKNIVFDIKKSVALEGNSGPYLQYTYARACSILRKIGRGGRGGFPLKILVEKEEILVLKLLYQFPEVVKEAAKKYSPNLICNYLFELGQTFNNFYEALPVLKAKSKELKKARLGLVLATAQVLKNGLNLLGISAPEKM